MSEQRRSARVASEFWVGIKGVDECMVLRRGDISISGIYVEAERPIGPLGSIQQLRLASMDQRQTLTVMARLLRVVLVDDLRRGRVILGAALEFLPTSPVQVLALAHLVRRVVSLQLDQEIDIDVDHELAASVGTGEHAALPAQVQRVGHGRITLETASPVKDGEVVAVELVTGQAADAPPVTLRGVVTSVAAVSGSGAGRRYRSEVRLQALQGAGEASSVSSALGSGLGLELSHLLEDLVTRQTPQDAAYPREHLTGQLSRIALTSLLGLFEMDRMTGELRLEHDGAAAVVAIKGGLLAAIDGEIEGASVRRRLKQLLGWVDGHFEFSVKEAAAMPRGAGLPITRMLLNAAVESDESSR